MVPLLFTTTYLTLTLLFNVTTYTLSREGLHVREGVIPAGFRDQRVARSAISGGIGDTISGCPALANQRTVFRLD